MMIICGAEDRSIDMIDKMEVDIQGDRLFIEAFTKHAIYQGHINKSKLAEQPLEKFKEYLLHFQYCNVDILFDRLKLTCYDVPITLTNSQILKLTQLHQQQKILDSAIERIQQDLLAKRQLLDDLANLIRKTQSDLKTQEQIFNQENLISTQTQIQIQSPKSFIQLLQRTKRFSQLNKISFKDNQVADESFKAFAERGHKFTQLKTVYVHNYHLTDASLKALAENGCLFLQLQKIYFVSDEMTDTALIALAENGHKFSQLQQICLGSYQITDTGLKSLAENSHKFLQIRKISLLSNQISDDFFTKELNEILLKQKIEQTLKKSFMLRIVDKQSSILGLCRFDILFESSEKELERQSKIYLKVFQIFPSF